MNRTMGRRIHAGLAWLFVAAVLVQVFLAGLGIFDKTFGFDAHIEFGYTAIGLIALAVLLAAIFARLPGREIGWSLLLLVLYVVQTILPSLRSDAPFLAALHPVNAIVLFALAGIIAWRSTRAAAA
jgi:Family of unknown function (DUF6220)